MGTAIERVEASPMFLPTGQRMDIWLRPLVDHSPSKEAKTGALRHLIKDVTQEYQDCAALTVQPVCSQNPTLTFVRGDQSVFGWGMQVHRTLVFIISRTQDLQVHCVPTDRSVRWRDVAQRFFSAQELSDVISRPPHLQLGEFLRILSLKMACQRRELAARLEDVTIRYTRSGCIRIERPDGEQNQPWRGSILQLELPGNLLISASRAAPSIFRSSFRVWQLGDTGRIEMLRPMAVRRSQPFLAKNQSPITALPH